MSQAQVSRPMPDGSCDVNWDDYLKAYYEKPQSARTWSGYEVKELYTQNDQRVRITHETWVTREIIHIPGEFTAICSVGGTGHVARW